MEELTTMFPSSSSPSSPSEHPYDVFLSFRGEDTRSGFTGYLYDYLSEKGIHTFIDDRLERGEQITPALFKAIEESKIAIVIFSVNYASSTFCLEELVKILECREQKHGSILPVFYKVDPSNVRHLRGSYEQALAKHEKESKNSNKLQNWKLALQEAANLSGWHFDERHKYEYEFVKRIVEEVSKRINHIPLYVGNYPVGLTPRVEKVISLLDITSEEKVVMVGIHGIGGIGKTTIACAVHNAIVDQFEGICFLFDVREGSKHDLAKLQETLLFKLVGDKGIKISNFREGIPIIKRKLCKRKILLILDDVNSKMQLEALVGGVDWFGSGSRIIITTRDKHLLDAHCVNRQYEVEKFCFKEALELLSWNAFKKNEVDSKYAGISSHVIDYCNGLPLALEIIGSSLFDKTQEEWKSILDTSEKNLPSRIQNVLEVSYNGLEIIEKEIFLDIACFFNGYYYLSDVKNILHNGRGYDPQHGIGVLVMKSLIKIEDQRVKIHDLIAQMGKEIVRSQSQSNPENWSRLWNYKDIRCVLEEDKGTDKIEVIVLNMPKDDQEVLWNGEAFKQMKNLKILIIESACFSCEPKYLPNSIRFLNWEGCPSFSLPTNFHPRNLTILNLRRSSLRSIKSFKNFVSLAKLDLSYCQLLKKVPDVSGAVNLKGLNIRNCVNLIEVHDSVGLLDKLESLCAFDCYNLRILPRCIKSTSFEFLGLSSCSKLRSLPQISRNANFKRELPPWGQFWGLLVIEKWIDGWRLSCGTSMLPKVGKWNDGFEHFSGDNSERPNPTLPLRLDIRTDDWNESKSELLMLKHFSSWRHYYKYSLTELRLGYCRLKNDFFFQQLLWFPRLNYLGVAYNDFTVLPECMTKCHSLKTLILDGCYKLREIKGIPPNIKLFSAICCTSLPSQSSSKLLSQAFHDDRGRLVVVPGFRIPKWLDCHQNESSISFWIRNEFPRLVVWYVYTDWSFCIRIHINGICRVLKPVHKNCFSSLPHISLIDVHEGDEEQSKITLKKNEWNHVSLVVDPRYEEGSIYRMGVHIFNKETGTEKFIDPNPKGTYTISYNLGLSVSKEFGPLLDKQVCDTIYSKKQDKICFQYNDEYFAESLTRRCIKMMRGIAKSLPRYLIKMRGMEAPAKVKVLVLKILNNSLPTYEYLFKKGLVNNPMCPICETKIETISHVFLECPWTQPLWFGSDIGRIVIQTPVFKDDMIGWLEMTFKGIEKVYPNAKAVIGLMGNICLAIWNARNEFVLSSKPVDPLEALMTAKAMHMGYSSNFSIHIGPTHEASTNITHQENAEDSEAEYKTKGKIKLEKNYYYKMKLTWDKENVKDAEAKCKTNGKRKLVKSSSIKMKPTCGKGNVKDIEVEHKTKRKRKLVGMTPVRWSLLVTKDGDFALLAKRKPHPNQTVQAVPDGLVSLFDPTVCTDFEQSKYFTFIKQENVKGTEVENKANPKGKGESNSNIVMEANCEKDRPINLGKRGKRNPNILLKVSSSRKSKKGKDRSTRKKFKLFWSNQLHLKLLENSQRQGKPDEAERNSEGTCP